MDPLAVGWAASGQPVSDDAGGSGRCARCVATTAAPTPVGKVVSNKFTGATDWADPQGSGLCPACTWGYRTLELRRQILLVDLASGGMSRLEQNYPAHRQHPGTPIRTTRTSMGTRHVPSCPPSAGSTSPARAVGKSLDIIDQLD